VPDDYVEAFRATAKTHHIRLAPIFFSNGKHVSPDQYVICLENALVEVMFSLRHYYYPGFKGKTESNTFTATLDQIRILKVGPVIRSPAREPTMKSLPRTPATQIKQGTVTLKRTEATSVLEESLTRAKKIRVIGTVPAPLCSPPSNTSKHRPLHRL
jgi:hypothetical protein